MITKILALSTIFIIGITPFLSLVNAEPTVSIIMEKTTYRYCEKLFYTIQVSEVIEDYAIIHITDESGKGSSPIIKAITQLENPIPSLIPFEAEIFPLGKYIIDIEYSGAKTLAEFELVESNSTCFSGSIKQIMISWVSGYISDGFLLDAIQRDVDKQLIDIPFEINENNKNEIYIPDWVNTVVIWWLEDAISDDAFSKMMNNLLERNIIRSSEEMKNEI